MSGYVLVVDDLGRVESSLAKVLAGTSLSIESFTSPLDAKRRLIVSEPRLIVSLTSFQNFGDGGFRLAEEISAHTELANIPVMLVAEHLTEDVIAHASRSGARSLMPWPVSIDSFKNRLKPFLADELAPKAAVSPTEETAIGPEAGTIEPTKPVEKIQLAQQLLAKVLHNLKTSALLEVVDAEDVPRVVFEITRAVCGAPEQKTEPLAVQKRTEPVSDMAKPAQSSSVKSEISLDLDAAFGRKK